MASVMTGIVGEEARVLVLPICPERAGGLARQVSVAAISPMVAVMARTAASPCGPMA